MLRVMPAHSRLPIASPPRLPPAEASIRPVPLLPHQRLHRRLPLPTSPLRLFPKSNISKPASFSPKTCRKPRLNSRRPTPRKPPQLFPPSPSPNQPRPLPNQKPTQLPSPRPPRSGKTAPTPAGVFAPWRHPGRGRHRRRPHRLRHHRPMPDALLLQRHRRSFRRKSPSARVPKSISSPAPRRAPTPFTSAVVEALGKAK